MLHAKLSASSSHRWLSCLGSVKAEEGLSDKGSSYAQEGTVAHDMAEKALNGIDINQFIGQKIDGVTVTKEMINHVHNYADYVKIIGGDQFYEVRVDFSNVVPEGFGTSDAIAVVGKTIHVIDLKYGQGVAVEAKDNPQAMLYAIGVMNDYGFIYDIDTVVIHIYQPRISNYSTWELSTDELNKWGEWVSERAKLALSPNAPRTPSDKACSFCKAKADCKALHDYTSSLIGADFDDLDNPETISDERKREIIRNKKLILGWIDAIESQIFDRLQNGESVEGFKLVNGRSSRKWIDDENKVSATLLEFLSEDELYKRSIISPAQAEKLIGKKNATALSDLIIKSEGAPTLAMDDDKRKSIDEKAMDDFEVL